MSTTATLDHRRLYRLPWSLPDNAISRLEPTSACNLACDGCYRENVPSSHKPLDVVREEIDRFCALRNADGMSIAGGDPLMHPEIVQIVRLIAERGVKPVLNTNGGRLTRELLMDLKRAGLVGFTFHVDSKQGRPGWKGKGEVELNELRREYAEMVAAAGGISCAFNSTVYEDTLETTPDLVGWAARHIDIVHVMVFILYRAAAPQLPFDFYAGARKVDMQALAYGETRERKIDLGSLDVVARIPARLGSKDRIYGYAGPRFMEAIQAGHPLFRGRYIAYAPPAAMRLGRTSMLLGAVDRDVRRIAGRWLAASLANPLRLFEPLHLQSIMIIQPVA